MRVIENNLKYDMDNLKQIILIIAVTVSLILFLPYLGIHIFNTAPQLSTPVKKTASTGYLRSYRLKE